MRRAILVILAALAAGGVYLVTNGPERSSAKTFHERPGALLAEWTISRPGPLAGSRVSLGHRAGSVDAIYLVFRKNGVEVIVEDELSSKLKVEPLALNVVWDDPARILVQKGGETGLVFLVDELRWQESGAAESGALEVPEG